MLFIYAGVRTVSAVVEWRQWDSLRFGEYGEAPFVRHVIPQVRAVVLFRPVKSANDLY